MARILLIEDSATQAAQFVQMLQSGGREVETATTLKEGLERLKGGGIDTLLLDLNLPDSEGLATFQAAHARAQRVPIVVLTHVDDEDLASATLQQGAQDYLVKGEVNVNWLNRAIQHAITRGRASAKAASTAAAEARPKLDAIIKFETIGDVALARVQGKQLLDPRIVEEMNDYLLRHIAGQNKKLIISMAQVEYISNGAIGVLLVLRRRMLAKSGRLCLCELRNGVAEQFTTRQFHRLFEILPDVETALRSLSPPGAAAQ